MAFTLQNDSGSVDNANAYIDLTYFRGYHTDRGTSTTDVIDADAQAAIVKATDYLDQRFRFRGDRLRREQRTQWPRFDAEDDDEVTIFGVPLEVKEACAEYALIAALGEINPSPTRDDSGQTIQSKSETVGPISKSVTYTGSGSFSLPAYPKADYRLRRLTESGGDLVRG